MSRQLPEGAEGAVILAIIYSYISWMCSVLMIWLTWAHDERLSYVACLAYYTLLSTTASIIQQAHDIAWWRDIAIEQYRRKIANPDSGDINVANGSVGLDLILYYIQFYSYIAQSLFVLFWASELAQSVYGLIERASWRRILRKVNASGKIASVVLPLVFVLGIQARHFRRQASDENVTLILGIPFLISLGLGSVLMLAILYRYIQSRRKLVRFDPHSRISANSDGSSNTSLNNRATTQGSSSPSSAASKHKGIYDKWLMTRFTIAFILLSVFQVSTILFDQTARQNARKDVQAPRPDLSAERASLTFYLFLPGNTPGIALFVVFGTTATFRSYMYQIFVPRRWQQQRRTRKNETPEPPASTASNNRAMMTGRAEDMFSLRDQDMETKSPVVVTTTKAAWRPAAYNGNDNDSAGFSLSVYEQQPARPGRVRVIQYSYNHDWYRDRDLELGFVGNDTAITGGGSRYQYQHSKVRYNG